MMMESLTAARSLDDLVSLALGLMLESALVIAIVDSTHLKECLDTLRVLSRLRLAFA